jgi:Cys-tRNA(Pro) deacylase
MTPSTNAVRLLREQGVAFTTHEYRYEEHGGTAVAAAALGVDERAMIKTLVMEDDSQAPVIVLMHGDREVSTKELARALARRSITPCDARTAERHTGYRVGGTSPFGTRRPIPVCLQASVADLETVYINGGSRGFLLGVSTAELIRVLRPTMVDVAV